MSSIAARRTGAKAQTFSARNPRELLLKSVKAAKHGNREILLSNFKTELRKASADYFDAIVDYWFSNNLTAIGADEDFPINTRFTAAARTRPGADVVSASVRQTLTPEEIAEASRKRKQAALEQSARIRSEVRAVIAANVQACGPSAIKAAAKYCKVVLMSMATPLGKPLSECTGAECMALGGWYVAIGAMTGEENTVGVVLTENDLQAALNGATV